MKKPPPLKHRVETRDLAGALNEVLIWHGDQLVFHLKRMAPDFIWFGSYVDGKAEDVEIKIADAVLTMNGKTPAPGTAARKSAKADKTKASPEGNDEEIKPPPSETSPSEPAT